VPSIGKETLLIYLVVTAVIIGLAAFASTAIINIFEGFSQDAMEFTAAVLAALIFFALIIGISIHKAKTKKEPK
jgi:hypothetical protein